MSEVVEPQVRVIDDMPGWAQFSIGTLLFFLLLVWAAHVGRRQEDTNPLWEIFGSNTKIDG